MIPARRRRPPADPVELAAGGAILLLAGGLGLAVRYVDRLERRRLAAARDLDELVARVTRPS